jgi:hypothetical protein
MPHDGEGSFEARGQSLVHVSLHLGQKIIIDVNIVLGWYAAACSRTHPYAEYMVERELLSCCREEYLRQTSGLLK